MFPTSFFEAIPPNFFEEQNLFPESPPPSLQRCAVLPVQGALLGCAFYGLKLFSVKVGFMRGDIGSPLPPVLFGAAYMLITEGARLAYATSLRILGNREEYEKLIDAAQSSTSDRLRQRAWKVISCMEKVPRAVDGIFSRIFHIRSAQEIKDQRVPDQDLRFVEIVRRCFLEQISETINIFTPIILANKVVESIGYQFLAVNAFRWLGGGVLLGLVNRVYVFYFKKEYREWLKEEHRKIYGTILDIMYPTEVEAIKNRKREENGPLSTDSIIVLNSKIEARKPSEGEGVNEQDFNRIIGVVDSYLRPLPL